MNSVVNYAKYTSLLFIMLLASACSTTWKPGDGEEYVDKKRGFALTQSPDWYRSPFRARGFLTYTKDGPDLQYIIVGMKKHKDAFKAIEKESSADDLPQSLAEDFVADLKASLQLDTVEILENAPATVGGAPGFKLEYEYKTESGLRYRERVYGVANKNGLYSVEFRAPVLHYYDRDIADFERIKNTFRVVGDAEMREDKEHFIR